MTQSQIITSLIDKAGSITELAKITKTHIARIYEWKGEKRGINFKKLLEMCEIMGIELKLKLKIKL